MNQPKWVLDQIEKAEEAYSLAEKTTVKERMLFMQSVADSIEGLGQPVDRYHMKRLHCRSVDSSARRTGDNGEPIPRKKILSKHVLIRKHGKRENDIRKCNIGMYPVLCISKASNSPFAFSTAGGDNGE